MLCFINDVNLFKFLVYDLLLFEVSNLLIVFNYNVMYDIYCICIYFFKGIILDLFFGVKLFKFDYIILINVV